MAPAKQLLTSQKVRNHLARSMVYSSNKLCKLWRAKHPSLPITQHKPRKQKRLIDRRDELLENVRAKYLKTGTVTKILTSRKVAKRSSTVGMNKTLERDR